MKLYFYPQKYNFDSNKKMILEKLDIYNILKMANTLLETCFKLQNTIISETHMNDITKYLEKIKNIISHASPHSDDQKFISGLRDIELFPHQIQTVLDMERKECMRYNNTKDNLKLKSSMGILGDLPGYGKSLSVVSLIKRDKMFWNTEIPQTIEIPHIIQNNKIFEFYRDETFTNIRETLIVVSTSIIAQWEKYFQHSDLKVLTITENKTAQHFEPNMNDVVLVSSTMYNNLMSSISSKKYMWKRFIYDEPTVTHIPSMINVNAGFYWFISATYYEIPTLFYNKRNSRGHFMLSIFNYIDRNKIYDFLVKNEDSFVYNSFRMPETRFKYHKCIQHSLLRVIGNHISKQISVMIQAGNIKGAFEALGSTKENDLISAISDKKRDDMKLCEMKMSYYKNKPEKYNQWKQKYDTYKTALDDIESKCSELESDDCPICFSELNEPVLLTCCQHLFCGGCILEWNKNKDNCPMCRSKTKFQNIIKINKKNKIRKEAEETKQTYKPKEETIIDLIKNLIKTNRDSKIIVFSDYDESFIPLKNTLKENKVDFCELKGTKQSKVKRLEEYRDGIKNVILLNSQTNCAGINLPETTDIILYHDMEYSIQTQIIGRANRIGRKGDLTVHKFTYT